MKKSIAYLILLFLATAIAATTLPTSSPTTVPTTASTTSPSTAPMAALAGVVVRDTDAKAPTTQTVANGGYVAGNLPKHWTLQFNFTGAQPKSIFYTIDGKQPHTEHYVPWVCEGDNVPINLPMGDHVVTWSVNGQSPQPFVVSVLPAPVFGENLEGVSTAAGDPTSHPQLLTATGTLKLSAVRLWLEGGFTRQQPVSYFKITNNWHKAGVTVIVVANFQNATPRCSAPADADWISYWSHFPASALTGIDAICLGNEINTNSYYNGTPQQLMHLMQLAYPILHQSGYTVVAGSDLNDISYYETLNKLSAFTYCDRIDVHAYYDNISSVLTAIDRGIAYGRSINKPCDSTELGLRMNANNLPAWAVAHAQLLTQLKTRSGYFLPFSFYPIESVDLACPLNAKYENNEPFYSAFAGTIGK